MRATTKRGALLALVALMGALFIPATIAGAQEGDDYTGALEVFVDRPSMRTCDDNAVTVEGFAPATTVTFSLSIARAEIGTATTDTDGAASLPFTLSNGLVGTTYTVTVVGVDQGGNPATLSSTVAVVAGDCTDGPGGTGDPNGPGDDELSRTGTDLSGALRIGLVLLAAGACLLLATRKRQARTA